MNFIFKYIFSDSISTNLGDVKEEQMQIKEIRMLDEKKSLWLSSVPDAFSGSYNDIWALRQALYLQEEIVDKVQKLSSAPQMLHVEVLRLCHFAQHAK